MPIVIAGAGPIGLYTAVCLAKQGYRVHVVDKFAGEFTRPGVVALAAEETISKELKKIGIGIEIPSAKSQPETSNISDIQRTLYQEAQKLGVKFTSAHFENIQGNTIKVEGSNTLINCDLLVDCTGESRKAINYVNSSNQQEIFTISSIADNPVKTHFVAFITMSEEDAKELSSFSGTESIVNEVRGREALRSQGWDLNDIPAWDMKRWQLSGGKEARFCCYFEMPDDLARAPEEKQKAWLGTLLELKAGKKINFTIEPEPLKFGAFKVDPKRVTNPIYQQGIYPFPIVACGDAMMSAEYRRGTGIRNGVICANGLVNSIKIGNDKKLSIDPNLFFLIPTDSLKLNTQTCINQHEKEIKGFYTDRKTKLADALSIVKCNLLR